MDSILSHTKGKNLSFPLAQYTAFWNDITKMAEYNLLSMLELSHFGLNRVYLIILLKLVLDLVIMFTKYMKRNKCKGYQ